MRALNFSKRNFKEIIRDPLSIIFIIFLPLFLLFIFPQFNIPNDMFKIENFTPGIVVFGFTFITLFTSTLISKDRGTSLLSRLYASPMKPSEYIFGYSLSVLPIVLIQNVIFFITAIFFGLDFNVNIIFAVLASIPISLIFISLGILIGSLVSDKAAPGVSSILVQLVVFTSGMYFPADMLGTIFKKICYILPFSRCIDIIREILNGGYNNILPNSIVLLIYIIITTLLAAIVFKRKMVKD